MSSSWPKVWTQLGASCRLSFRRVARRAVPSCWGGGLPLTLEVPRLLVPLPLPRFLPPSATWCSEVANSAMTDSSPTHRPSQNPSLAPPGRIEAPAAPPARRDGVDGAGDSHSDGAGIDGEIIVDAPTFMLQPKSHESSSLEVRQRSGGLGGAPISPSTVASGRDGVETSPTSTPRGFIRAEPQRLCCRGRWTRRQRASGSKLDPCPFSLWSRFPRGRRSERSLFTAL
jgi:hypothetical protein